MSLVLKSPVWIFHGHLGLSTCGRHEITGTARKGIVNFNISIRVGRVISTVIITPDSSFLS